MSTKPSFMDELNKERLARYEQCAAINGQTLNEWVAEVLDCRALIMLGRERPEPEPVLTPKWMDGLSARAVEVLGWAELDSREAVIEALANWEPEQWIALRNCGNKVYQEVREWAGR